MLSTISDIYRAHMKRVPKDVKMSCGSARNPRLVCPRLLGDDELVNQFGGEMSQDNQVRKKLSGQL